MLKNKDSKNKNTFLVLLSLVFIFISSAVYADEIKEIWNHISLKDTEFNTVDIKTRSIWEIFEKSSIQRGLVVKPNYQPFVPIVNRIIILDTPAGELVFRNYSLRVETEVISGEDVRITELTLSKISDKKFPGATMEQQFGYAKGKLGERITYWIAEKKVIPEELSATEQLKLESFKRSIDLEYSGDFDHRRVSSDDVFYFFPEIRNDLKADFNYVYPQNDRPMFKTTYEPGRIRFGSLLDTDIKITFIHNIISAKMIHGEISWKETISKFTTAEELALGESFFNFMQESLAKENFIAPASPVLY